MPKIRSDYSAQRIDAQPNPMLVKCLNRMAELQLGSGSAVDLGCGKLRHLTVLRRRYREITLVDTALQLGREHKLGTKTSTIPEYVDALRKRKGETLTVMEFGEFSKAKPLRVGVVFCVAVFDVVLSSTRRELARAAKRHLRRDGLFVLVVPRNDSSIVRRCTAANAFQDGHVFAHHGVHTFFRNFDDSASLARSVCRQGFTLLHEISVYRQVGLLLRKE